MPRYPLAEIDGARRAWHAATEESRRRALVADSELRRRHRGMSRRIPGEPFN